MPVNLQRTRTVKVHPFHLWKKGKFGTVHDSSLGKEGGMSILVWGFLGVCFCLFSDLIKFTYIYIKLPFQNFGLAFFAKGSTSKVPAYFGI